MNYATSRHASADHSKTIAESNPAIPEKLNDREQDNWEPLLAIADAVGGHWPETQDALLWNCHKLKRSVVDCHIQLLSDIRQVFSEKDIDSVSSKDLIEALCADEERPWSTFKQGARSRQDRWPPNYVDSTLNQNRSGSMTGS